MGYKYQTRDARRDEARTRRAQLSLEDRAACRLHAAHHRAGALSVRGRGAEGRLDRSRRALQLARAMRWRRCPSCRCTRSSRRCISSADLTLGLGTGGARLHGQVTRAARLHSCGLCWSTAIAISTTPRPRSGRRSSRGRGGQGSATMLTICTRLDEFEAVQAIAAGDPDIWCSVGVHPHEAAAEPMADAAPLIALADASQGRRDRRDRARFLLRPQPARAPGRIVPRPCRGVARDRPAAHRPYPRRRCRDRSRSCARNGRQAGSSIASAPAGRLAEAALEIGFYISLSGIVTFKNATALRAIVRDLPLDRLLIETDAPYLAPVPMRGRAQRAGLHRPYRRRGGGAQGVRADELARRTAENFFRLFAKAAPPGRRAMRVTMLGCGPSWGVPRIGGDWGACDPANPKNRRRRVSLLVEEAGARAAGRYLARPARAASRCRRARASTPCSSPMRMPTTFTGSTIFARSTA